MAYGKPSAPNERYVMSKRNTVEVIQEIPRPAPFFTRLMEGPILTLAVEKVSKELEDLRRRREAAQKRKEAAELELHAIEPLERECTEFLELYRPDSKQKAPTKKGPAKQKQAPSKGAKGTASTSEVLAALKKAGPKGMSLAALRYAVGNKLIKQAVDRLGDKVLIPAAQKTHGQGLIIRLV